MPARTTGPVLIRAFGERLPAKPGQRVRKAHRRFDVIEVHRLQTIALLPAGGINLIKRHHPPSGFTPPPITLGFMSKTRLHHAVRYWNLDILIKPPITPLRRTWITPNVRTPL
jgi:hypothetical protein